MKLISILIAATLFINVNHYQSRPYNDCIPEAWNDDFSDFEYENKIDTVLIDTTSSDTTLIDTTRNPYYDIDWAAEFAKLDNKLDSMDMNINELIIYEIENYNDTITKNK